MPATQKPKTSYYYKLFRVKRKDGRVTTVSMDPILVTQACKTIQGGVREVGKLVREAALAFEDGMFKSCSGYVSKQLREEVERQVEARKAAKAAAESVALAA